jgi:4-methylaminobutanoate oxidase (formaldehyde-forming)
VWGTDITPDYNPYDAGLGFCVAADKGSFLARDALASIKAQGPTHRLRWFTAPGGVDLHGGEIVLAADRVLGRVTSAGYGYTVGKNILCAYLASEEPHHPSYEIEAMGIRYPAMPHSKPLYDPERRALLA